MTPLLGVDDMIRDLDRRREHWDDPRNRAPREEHDLADSLPYPFEPVEHLFAGQDVLEIGPGRGRQYDRLRHLAGEYAICDISPSALAEPVFAGVARRFLLTDYTQDFVYRFNVVHFWYVLHHVREDELGAFFSFAARHLRSGGVALFNTPITTNAPEWYTGDGTGTTCHRPVDVVKASQPYLDVVAVYNQNDRSSGALFVMEKI